MAVADSALQLTQTKKEFWEGIGARFSLKKDGGLEATCTGGLDYDSRAKRDLIVFMNDHDRDLHALVLTDGDPAKLHRFESVMWEREHLGRFTEELP